MLDQVRLLVDRVRDPRPNDESGLRSDRRPEPYLSDPNRNVHLERGEVVEQYVVDYVVFMADEHCKYRCGLKAAVKNGSRVMYARDGEPPSLAATVLYLVEVAYKFCAVYYVHVCARRQDTECLLPPA